MKIFGTEGQKSLHCPGTKGQRGKLKILPRVRTGRDGQNSWWDGPGQTKSGTGRRTKRDRAEKDILKQENDVLKQKRTFQNRKRCSETGNHRKKFHFINVFSFVSVPRDVPGRDGTSCQNPVPSRPVAKFWACPVVPLSWDNEGISVPLSRKVAPSRPVGNPSSDKCFIVFCVRFSIQMAIQSDYNPTTRNVHL